MVRASDLAPLRRAADDFGQTEALKRELADLRRNRAPFYLDGSDLQRILAWKLRGQLGRQAGLRAQNSDLAYKVVTRATFEMEDPTFNYEAEVRLGLLTSLYGVGVPVASAILALVEPARYAVIDFRGWRAMFNESKRSFVIADCLRYYDRIRPLAQELGWGLQETDAAIWTLDMMRHPV